MIPADSLHYYPTQGSEYSDYKKTCRGKKKKPSRTRKSSTLLHHQVHNFMEHGVDPLVEIGGQHTLRRQSRLGFGKTLGEKKALLRRKGDALHTWETSVEAKEDLLVLLLACRRLVVVVRVLSFP
jgi:hypothetical protein